MGYQYVYPDGASHQTDHKCGRHHSRMPVAPVTIRSAARAYSGWWIAVTCSIFISGCMTQLSHENEQEIEREIKMETEVETTLTHLEQQQQVITDMLRQRCR